jgi:hypothetical protein
LSCTLSAQDEQGQLWWGRRDHEQHGFGRRPY